MELSLTGDSSAGAEAAEIGQAALADDRVQAALGGKTPRKVIVVRGKIVNIVPK